MIKSLFDVEQFMERLKGEGSRPLSELTGGIHIHTIEADSREIMDRIIQKLRQKGFLISQEV
jgi:transcriptional regulator of NAD metabolism